ncbi:MAG TPA: hypothetical protein VE959_33225 [Bryobacteraceae bacterium]|nr:hypothetical protein [Bryobacteraceae bacterium]
MKVRRPVTISDVEQQELYHEAAAAYGAALDRLARCYEADPEKRRDLLQDPPRAVAQFRTIRWTLLFANLGVSRGA